MSSRSSSKRNSEDSSSKEDIQAGEHVSAEDKSSFYSFIKTVASFTGDLSQLTCPGFLLCGNSILEYCSHYGDHPKLFNNIAACDNSLDRTVAVARWFLSSLYGSFRSRCKDTFEKKPYNPILGERFICSIEEDGGDKINFCCEQVSHHPPISAFYIESPSQGIFVNGHCGQKSKFKGTTIKVDQTGHLTVRLSNCDDVFIVTLPSMNIRSLITGRPFLDLFGESYVYSSSGHLATIIYNQKPWFGGDYFGIEGHVKDSSNQVLKTISGKWTEEFIFTDRKTEEQLAFNSGTTSHTKTLIEPLENQSPLESRRLWGEVSQAIASGDYSQASKKKAAIEEQQRKLRREREESKVEWVPEFFRYEENDSILQKVQSAFKTPLSEVESGSWAFKEQKK